MKRSRITQWKSAIGATKSQKKIMEALGLGKLNRPVEQNASPEILGMVRKLQHLLRVEEVNE